MYSVQIFFFKKDQKEIFFEEPMICVTNDLLWGSSCGASSFFLWIDPWLGRELLLRGSWATVLGPLSVPAAINSHGSEPRLITVTRQRYLKQKTKNDEILWTIKSSVRFLFLQMTFLPPSWAVGLFLSSTVCAVSAVFMFRRVYFWRLQSHLLEMRSVYVLFLSFKYINIPDLK